MPNLSPRQREILKFIDQFMREYGYPPTLREICKKFSFSSTNGARYHLYKLKKLGFLDVQPHTSRGVKRVTISKKKSQGNLNFRLPILGRVPAGPLDLAEPDIREDEISVDPQFFGSRAQDPELFGLRVNGDSMIEEGIYNGDIVVVRSQQTASDGEIVVARVEDEATVKRFKRIKNDILLEPANPSYAPIRLENKGGMENGQDIGILGVVVGLIRAM